METLTNILTKNGGDILEVGFGLGIATNFIRQHKNIRNHTIIEFHPDVIKNCKKIYSKEINSGKIKLLEGFWENIVPNLSDESVDGILFDTYPLSEKQIHKNHFWFFKEAYRLLIKKGILTYYSDESKSFSEEHIEKLHKAGFIKIDSKICNVNPPKNCMYWSKRTILAPIIIK
ncbi:MAG: methyltransferase domain-containing protein [Candidatus Aenigmarchaeota archaeon]|nr:methyltransferase domain-containing protein [Candidatus Aenigmarchaeota archaeon]